MTNLIVLNPVIEMLLGKDGFYSLKIFLTENGWYVRGAIVGKTAVLEQTREYLDKKPPKPVIDSRCPLVVSMIIKEFPGLVKNLSPVLPILITGALAEKDLCLSKLGGQVNNFLVITPCTALKFSYQKFEGMLIETWKVFNYKTGLNLPEQILTESPVPPGFFNELHVPIAEANGETEVRSKLSNFDNLPPETEFLELLACKGGCIAGDGL